MRMIANAAVDLVCARVLVRCHLLITVECSINNIASLRKHIVEATLARNILRPCTDTLHPVGIIAPH